MKIPDGVDVGNLLLSPLRYCGGKWNALSTKEEKLTKKISQIVQKFFLSLAIALAYIPAIPGSIIKSCCGNIKEATFVGVKIDKALREFFNSLINENAAVIGDKIIERIGKPLFNSISVDHLNNGYENRQIKILLNYNSSKHFLSYISDCFSQRPSPENPEQIRDFVHLLFQSGKKEEQISFIEDYLSFNTQVCIRLFITSSTKKDEINKVCCHLK